MRNGKRYDPAVQSRRAAEFRRWIARSNAAAGARRNVLPRLAALDRSCI
jgi:hypothetical protein